MNPNNVSILGRKIFFLNLSTDVKERIISVLREEEYEVYFLDNYRYAKNALREYPDSIFFLQIDDHSQNELDTIQWFNFLDSFTEDENLCTILIGIISKRMPTNVRSYFMLKLPLAAGMLTIRNGTESVLENIKEVLKINETPVDLGSLFPTYVMFKELQKQNIRYIFTGDGPDELFGGYKRIDEYDSQLSDIFYELSFYHFPRLNKLARYFGLILKTPWCDEEMVRLAVNLPLEDRTHKKIMKDNFKGLIPEEIINREKRPLKNDLIKEDKRSYRNELVELFYEIMDESDDKILSEIYNECSKCSNQYSCPEEECALYRIEQIVLEEGEK